MQSFFCTTLDAAREGGGWTEAEIGAWLRRLERVRDSGARVLEVQLYTLARRPAEAFIQPVSGEFLAGVRARVEALGIPAKVYGVAE